MNKIALFGGTFDPIHLGHRDCLEHLVKNTIFSKIILIPASQNPLKLHQKPASPTHRLRMIELILADYGDTVSIDNFETKKQHPSYTFETLKHYEKCFSPENLYFVMGLDTFQKFDQWKNFKKILNMTNLLVISRPPHRLTPQDKNLPKGLQTRVQFFKKNFVLLDTGRHIDFLEVKTRNISSSLVRKKIETGQSFSKFVDPRVEKYIKKNNVYPISNSRS